jgi:hypothetical protein
MYSDVSSKQYNTYRCIAMYYLSNTIHIDAWRCVIQAIQYISMHSDVLSKQYNTYRYMAMYHLNNTVQNDVSSKQCRHIDA